MGLTGLYLGFLFNSGLRGRNFGNGIGHGVFYYSSLIAVLFCDVCMDF